MSYSDQLNTVQIGAFSGASTRIQNLSRPTLLADRVSIDLVIVF